MDGHHLELGIGNCGLRKYGRNLLSFNPISPWVSTLTVSAEVSFVHSVSTLDAYSDSWLVTPDS
jgi:hypothetical protein